ncbi:MAG: hypothetical protein HFE85_02520 [Clostridiales bacterium]|nr:hypothetical protein [Clostridiales bacterium]
MSKSEFLMFKGRPLVRKGNTLYYGDMSEPYVVMLQILDTQQENGIESAKRVRIQLMSTDPDAPISERVSKKSEKDGLYNALDIASIWLDRTSKA